MYFKGEREGFEVIWRAKRFGRVRGGVPLILKKYIYISYFLYYVNLYLFL